MTTDTREYVLVNGVGDEEARGTPAEIGDAILSYDGRGWGAEEKDTDEDGDTYWNAYRYVGSKIEHLIFIEVRAKTEAEATEKLKILAFITANNGHDRHLSVDLASDFDASQEDDDGR